MKNTNILEYNCDFFAFRTTHQIAVINLKDNFLNLGINLELKSKFFSLFSEVESNPKIRSLLIINSPDSLSENTYRQILLMISANKHDDSIDINRYMNMLYQIIMRISGFRKMVVAAFQGEIAATFLGPALACDFRFASHGVHFKSAFLNFDIPPCGGLGYFLPKYIGHGRALELLLTDMPINAIKAQKLGLINEIIYSKAFERECVEKTRQLSTLPFCAVKYTRALLSPSTIELQKNLEHEIRLMERGYRNVTKSIDNKGGEF